MSAAVVSTSVIGSAATMIHFGAGSSSAISCTCSRKVRAFAKISGRVEAEDDGALEQLGLRVRADVVEAGEPLDLAQDRLVGPPGAPEHVQDRQRDRDPDARQDAEERHREERRDAQRELRAAATEQVYRAAQVGE